MKWNLILIFASVLFFIPFANSDVISINSGGDEGLIIHPGDWIEGFFFTDVIGVTSCGVLSSSNTVYVLSNNLSSEGTCFTVDADNITLDCEGHSVSYSSLVSGYGLVNNGHDFLTLKNCEFNLTNQTLTNSYGIYVYGGALNNSLENLKVTTTSISSAGNKYNHGIYFNGVDNSVIKDSDIDAKSSGYLGYSNYGIILSSSDNNTILNNFINTSSYLGYGISLSSSSDNDILNSVISTYKENSYGVYFNSASRNYFYNNSITTYEDDAGGDSSFGVYFYSGNDNIFRNNNVTTYKAPCFVPRDGYGNDIDTSNLAEGKPVWFNDSLSDYTFQDVNFSEYGQVVCAGCDNVVYDNVTIRYDGLLFGGTDNSSIYDSDVISNTSHGIYLFYSDNNLIDNTNISKQQGYVNALKIRNSNNNDVRNSYIYESSNDYAIYMQNSDYNTFYNNLIDSDNSYAILFYGSTDYENFTLNTIETDSYCFHLDSGSSTESYFERNDFSCGSGYAANAYRGSNNYLFTDNDFNGDKILFSRADSSHRFNITNGTDFGGFYYTVQTSNTGQVNWYLDVYVNNTKGEDVEDANVTSWNDNLDFRFSELTESTGWIERQILKEYYQDYDDIYYDNDYIMNTTKFGYFDDFREFELTDNRIEYVTLNGTPPVITIISPNATANYTALEIDFNISVEEDENVSWCGYSLNETSNITMLRVNDSYFWYEPENLIPGTHNVTFYCNDTSGNWGTNFTNFTILDEAAIAIQLSPALSWNVNWSLNYLPAEDLHAEGNNEENETDYWVNISATSVSVDLYVRADGDLLNDALDAIGLGNETFCVNLTNSSVPDLDRITMNTTYILIGEALSDQSLVYLKFYLDAPASQPAGTYLNNLEFKAVMHGNPV